MEEDSELKRNKQLIFIKEESNKLVMQIKQPVIDFLTRSNIGLMPIDVSLSIITTATLLFSGHIFAALSDCEVGGIEAVTKEDVDRAEEIIKLEKEYGHSGDSGTITEDTEENKQKGIRRSGLDGNQTRSEQVENGANSTGSNPSFSSSSDFRSGQI